MALTALISPCTSAILPSVRSAKASMFPTELASKNPLTENARNVVAWVKKAWEGKPYSEKDWHAVRVGLTVSDNTKILEINPYRVDILKNGASNPDIPTEALHEAIYTAGEMGAAIGDPRIKQELSSLLLPYTQRVLTEFHDEEGTKVRYQVSQVSPGTKVFDFREPARSALAKIADKEVISNTVEALMAGGRNPHQVSPHFSFLQKLSPDIPLDKAESRAHEWIYLSAEEAKKDSDGQRKPMDIKAEPLPLFEIPGFHEQAAKEGLRSDESPPAGKIQFLVPGKLQNPLEGLSSELTTPRLRQFTNPEEKLLAAQAIRFLSKRDGKIILPAIAQWFRIMNPAEHLKGASAEDDLMMLEALAIQAVKDSKALNLLKTIVASEPQLARNALLIGGSLLKPGALHDAGVALEKVFKAHPDEMFRLIEAMSNGQAELIWPKSLQDKNIQAIDQVREVGQLFARIAMASERTGLFADSLRKIANNPYDKTQKIAIAGLAALQDGQSVEKLVAIAASKTQDPALRTLALESILKVAGTPELLPEVAEKAKQESVFDLDFASNFLRFSLKTNETELALETNPFHENILRNYNKWLNQQEQVNREALKQGRVPESVPEEQKLEKFLDTFRCEFGGNGQLLQGQAQNPVFQKHLDEMMEYLQTSGKKIDMDLALPMIELLKYAEYSKAAPLLAKMAVMPEKFIPKYSNDAAFSTKAGILPPAAVKIFALEALGSTIDPADPNTRILHDVLNDPYRQFQMAGLKGLAAMGNRIQERLSSLKEDSAERNNLLAVQSDHIQKALAFMNRIESGYTDMGQRRRVKDLMRYETAKAIDALGGTKELLRLAQEEWDKDAKSPITRAIAHALIYNGRTGEDSQKLGFNPRLINFFANKEYWIGDLPEQGYTGKGGEHAHFDVGHINPIGPLKPLVQYPSWIKWSDKGNWDGPHPTGTAETFRQVAPGIDKIYSYNVSERLLHNPDKPETSQDSILLSLEDLIQKQMTGETKVLTTNHSYGMGILMYDEELRSQVVDLVSAYLEALGETGVTNFVSAGNEQGGEPFKQYDPTGAQNLLGSRINKDGKVTKGRSTIVVAAADGFLQWLAEFSSMPNPLRLDDALEMLCAPGYQDLTLYKEGNDWKKRKPVDGTSFSSPNLAALGNVLKVIRRDAGFKPWTPEQLEQVLRNSSNTLPGREAWESGLYVNSFKLFQYALLPAPEPAKP